MPQRVNAEGRSMGMALTSCTVPAAGEPTLPARRGRDGDRHRHPRGAGARADAARARRPDHRAARDGDRRRPPVPARAIRCSPSSTGMGGTPLIELYIVYRALNKFLDGRGITIARNLIGPYMTSLEMAGLLDHAAAARRRAHPPVGRAGRHAGACAGGDDQPMSAGYEQVMDWVRRFAAEVAERNGRARRSSTRRSATATTGRTWTVACARRSRSSRPSTGTTSARR